MKIVTARRFGLWWKLAQRWFKKQRREAVASVDESIDIKIVPYLYAECSDEEIDHMFEPLIEEGDIVVPEEIIDEEGAIDADVFEAVTGLTPINNE